MRVCLILTMLLVFSHPVLAHNGGAVPADLWTHWNTDPLLLMALLLPAYLYGRGTATYRVARWRIAAFVGGIVSLFTALISPVDALGATLFSGHMIQHMLFIVIAAPLLVFSRPLPVLLRGLPKSWRKVYGRVVHTAPVIILWSGLVRPVPASLLHIVVIWGWHIPALYNVVIADPVIHALQHISFFGTALLFWWLIFYNENYLARIMSVFGVMMTTGLLGALMTLSSIPWYTNHALFVGDWGLTLIEDQQLAGLVMWIPPGFLYVVAAALLLGAWLNAMEHKILAGEIRMMREISDA